MTATTPRDEDLEMNKMGLLSEEMKDIIPTAPEEGGKAPKGPWSKVIDGFCICLNIVSTVTLVFLNNWSVCANMNATTKASVCLYSVPIGY